MAVKKILLVTFSNISDHQDKVVVLYEEMRKAGENVFLMLSDRIDVECEHNERTYFVKCPNRPGIVKGTFNFKNLFSALRIIKKERFDYIIFETLHIWNIPIMLLSRRFSKIFQVIHDITPHEGDKSVRQVDFMNKIVCKLANKILICNNKYKESLHEKYLIPIDRIVTIGLWERYPAFQETPQNGTMLFFGRLNPYKGSNNLLQIAKLCPNIKFRIVGKADPQVKEIIDELKTLKNATVDERYINDNEISSIFRHCEWILLPYNSATQSGVVVEAYKHSKPVIAFDVGAISEQIEDGKTGFLIPATDIDAFVQKIEEVISIPADRYVLFCRDAYNYGYKNFSPQRVAKKLNRLFI